VSSPQQPGRAPRKRRARGSISAEEILRGAYELASEESLEALSMPRLAQRLDVGVTSIYWYFRSKDELLDTLAERAMAEFARQFTVPDDLPWDEHLHAYFRNFRRLLREQRLLCDLIVMRGPHFTPAADRLAAQRIDLVLQKLVSAGFPPDTAMFAYSSLSVFTRGSVALERTAIAEGRPPLDAGTYAGVPEVSVLPRLEQQHPLSMTGDEDFDFGLENSLRGLRALLEDLLADEPCMQEAGARAERERVRSSADPEPAPAGR
jgi:AcrR family transcriptional regulator